MIGPSLDERVRLRDVLLLVARVILGWMLLWYSLAKIQDPSAFLKAVREYGMLPEEPAWPLNLTAILLPWVELTAGAFLLLGLARRGTAAVMTLVLVTFTAAVLWRSLQIQEAEGLAFCAVAFDCGCGTGVVNVCSKLAQNLALIGLALWLSLAREDRLGLLALLGQRRR